jgi:hypothetical protein
VPTAAPALNQLADIPTGCSPNRALIRIDERALRELGGFGAAPQNVLEAPAYAVRVRLRRRGLLAEVRRLHRELEAAEAQRDGMLATLVDSVRAALEADARFSARLQEIRRIDRADAAQDEAFDVTHGEYAAHANDLDQALASARQRLSQEQAIEEKLAAEFELQARNERRAIAAHRRVLIELRTQQQLAPSRKNTEPDLVRNDLATLHARAATLVPVMNEARRKCESARERYAAHHSSVMEAEARVCELEGRRRELDAKYARQLESRSLQRDLASRQRRAALADIGREALAARAVPFDARQLALLTSADGLLARLTHEHEKHLRALDICDHGALRRGYAIMLAAFVIALLALTGLAISASGPL